MADTFPRQTAPADLGALMERLARLLAALEGAGLKPLLVDIRQLAKLLGCSRRHVERQRSAGELPEPLMIGSKLAWRTSDIELFIRVGCDMDRFRAALARR